MSGVVPVGGRCPRDWGLQGFRPGPRWGSRVGMSKPPSPTHPGGCADCSPPQGRASLSVLGPKDHRPTDHTPQARVGVKNSPVHFWPLHKHRLDDLEIASRLSRKLAGPGQEEPPLQGRQEVLLREATSLPYALGARPSRPWAGEHGCREPSPGKPPSAPGLQSRVGPRAKTRSLPSGEPLSFPL